VKRFLKLVESGAGAYHASPGNAEQLFAIGAGDGLNLNTLMSLSNVRFATLVTIIVSRDVTQKRSIF
jgi:hypothetical protein